MRLRPQRSSCSFGDVFLFFINKATLLAVALHQFLILEHNLFVKNELKNVLIFLFCLSLKIYCQKAWCFVSGIGFLKLFFCFAKTQTWSTGHAEVRDFTELWPTFLFHCCHSLLDLFEIYFAQRELALCIFFFLFTVMHYNL